MASSLINTSPTAENTLPTAPVQPMTNSTALSPTTRQSRFTNMDDQRSELARELPFTRSLMAAAAPLVPTSSSISMYRSQDLVELIRTRHATLAEALHDQSFDDDIIANIEHSACDDDPQQTQLLDELRRIDRQYRQKLAQIDQMEYHLLTAQGRTVTSNTNQVKREAEANFVDDSQRKKSNVDANVNKTKSLASQQQNFGDGTDQEPPYDGSKLRNLASFLDIGWLQSTQAQILVPTRPEVVQHAENPMYARMSALRRQRQARNWRVELSRRRHSVVEFHKHAPVTITAGSVQQKADESSSLGARGDGRASLIVGTTKDEVIKNQDGRAFSEQNPSIRTAVMFNRYREARRRRKMHAALNQHVMALMPKSRNALQYIHFDAVKRQRRRENKQNRKEAERKKFQNLKIQASLPITSAPVEPHETRPIFTAKPSTVIVFDNYQPGECYEHNFEVLNISHVSSHCRASAPSQTVIFRLELLSTATERSGCMAPGMSTHYRVTFRPDSRADFYDVIEFYGVFGAPLRVQLIARRPVPALSLPFEPSNDLILGKTVPGTRLTTTLPIECTWMTKKIVMPGKNRDRTVHDSSENESILTDTAFVVFTQQEWTQLDSKRDVKQLISAEEAQNSIESGKFIVRPRHFVLHGRQNSTSNEINVSFSYCSRFASDEHDDSLTLFFLAENAAVRTMQLRASCVETHVEFSSPHTTTTTVDDENEAQVCFRQLKHDEYGDRSADFVADFGRQNPHSTNTVEFALHNPFQVGLPFRWRVVDPICEQRRIKTWRDDGGVLAGRAKYELELDWWQEQPLQSSIFSVQRISPSGSSAATEANGGELILDAGETAQFALVCRPETVFSESLATIQLVMSKLVSKLSDSSEIAAWKEYIMLGFLAKVSSISYEISVKPLTEADPLGIIVGTTRSVYVLFTNQSLASAPIFVAPYEDANIQAIPRPQQFHLSSGESIKIHHTLTAFEQTGLFELQLPVSVHGEHLRSWRLRVACSPPPLSFVPASASPLHLNYIQLGQPTRTTISLQNHSDLNVEWRIVDCLHHQPPQVVSETKADDARTTGQRPALRRDDTRVLCPYTLEHYDPLVDNEKESLKTGENTSRLVDKDTTGGQAEDKVELGDKVANAQTANSARQQTLSTKTPAVYELKLLCTSSTSPVPLQHARKHQDSQQLWTTEQRDDQRHGTLESLQIQHFILELRPLVVGKHSLKLQAFCRNGTGADSVSSGFVVAAELVVDWTAQLVSLQFEPSELLLTNAAHANEKLFINVPLCRPLRVHNRSDINVKFHFGPLHAIPGTNNNDDALVLEAHVVRTAELTILTSSSSSAADRRRFLQNQSPSSTIFHLAPRASKTLLLYILVRVSSSCSTCKAELPCTQTASLPCYIHGFVSPDDSANAQNINNDDDNLLESTHLLNKPSLSIPLTCCVNGLDVDLQLISPSTGEHQPLSASIDFGIDNTVGLIRERTLIIRNVTAITTHITARIRWRSLQVNHHHDDDENADAPFGALFPKKQTRISYYSPTAEKKVMTNEPPAHVPQQVGALFSVSPDEAVLQPFTGTCTLCIRAASNLWGTFADFVDLQLDETMAVGSDVNRNSANNGGEFEGSSVSLLSQQLQRKSIQIPIRYGSIGCPLTFQLLRNCAAATVHSNNNSSQCTLRFGAFAFGVNSTTNNGDELLHLQPRTLQINNPLPLPIQIEWETSLLTYGGETVNEPVQNSFDGRESETNNEFLEDNNEKKLLPRNSRQVVDVVFRPNDSLSRRSSTADSENKTRRKVVDVFFALHEGSKCAQNIVAVIQPDNSSPLSSSSPMTTTYTPPNSSVTIRVALDASKVNRAGVVRVLCLGRLRVPDEYKNVPTFARDATTTSGDDAAHTHVTHANNSWTRFDGYYAQPLRFEVTAEAKPTFFYIDLPQTSRSLTFHAKISDLFVQRQQISVAELAGSCRKFVYESSAEAEQQQQQQQEQQKPANRKSQTRSCIHQTLAAAATFSSRQKIVANSSPPPPLPSAPASEPTTTKSKTAKFAASPLTSPQLSNTRGWSINKFYTAKCIRTLRLVNCNNLHMKFRIHVPSPPFRIERVLCLSLRPEDHNTDRSVTDLLPSDNNHDGLNDGNSGFYCVKGQQNVDVHVEFGFDYAALAKWQQSEQRHNSAAPTSEINPGRVVLRDHVLTIEFGGLQTSQVQKVPLFVSILTSKLEWSVENLQFRECLVHQCKDLSFSLRNRSNTAALWKVSIVVETGLIESESPTQNYHPFLATPSTGWLPAHETDAPDQSKQIITVQFRPKLLVFVVRIHRKPVKTEAYLVVYDTMEQALGRIRLCGTGTLDYSAQER